MEENITTIYNCMACKKYYKNSNGKGMTEPIQKEFAEELRNLGIGASSGYCSKTCYKKGLKDMKMPEEDITQLLQEYDNEKD